MTGEPLDYSGALAYLAGLVGTRLEYSIRTASGPLVASWDGELTRGGDVRGGRLFGYDDDAISLSAADVELNFQPQIFVAAKLITEGSGERRLEILFQDLWVGFRSPPA